MIICNRCGRPAGDHRQEAVKKLCASRPDPDPATLKAAQKKGLAYISRIRRPHSPSRPRNPHTIH